MVYIVAIIKTMPGLPRGPIETFYGTYTESTVKNAARTRLVIALGMVLTGVVLSGNLYAANRKWVVAKAPGVEIYTNGNEGLCHRVFNQFQQARRVFQSAVAGGQDVPLAVRVIVFADDEDWKAVRPAVSSSGFFQSGPERDYIALRYSGEQSDRILFHEYVHLVLNHSSVVLPTWLEEGTAEFYSTLETGDGEVRIGLPIQPHLATLANQTWLGADAFRGINHASPYYNEVEKVGIFYAQSWALVHMLNLSPRYRDNLPRFLLGLADNKSPEVAFEAAFGEKFDATLIALRDYVRGNRLGNISVELPPSERTAAQVETITPSAALLLRADLFAQTGRTQTAEALYQRIVKDFEPNAEIETALGSLALKQGHDGEARRHLERAISLGSKEGATYFEYAMLLRDAKAPREEVDAALRQAVEMNPNFAEAQFLLGLRASERQAFAESVGHLKIAVRILPRQVYFWHALAYSYHKLGEDAQSRDAAYHALNAAGTEQEQEMARAALRLTGDVALPSSTKPAVSVPPSWENKRGEHRAEGKLTRFECLAEGARLWLDIKGEKKSFDIIDPNHIAIRNGPAGSLQFTCGPQSGVAIAVEYTAANEVTAIEYR